MRNTGAIIAVVLIAILGLLMAIAIPNFARAKEEPRQPIWVLQAKKIAEAKVCISNLRQIQMAKQVWAVDTGVSRKRPSWSDLLPYLVEKPVCPSGGKYKIGNIDALPTCSIGDDNTKSTDDDHILE